MPERRIARAVAHGTAAVAALVLAAWAGAAPAREAGSIHPYLLAQAPMPAEASPRAVDPLYRAMAQMALGEPARACATLAEGYPDERDNVDVLLLKGRCLYRTGRFDESVAQYERLAELQGDVYLVRFELARAYAASGRLSSARGEFERVLTLNPPPIIGESVQRQLDFLTAAAKPWSVDLSAAYVYDSNINAGPSSGTFEAFGLPFQVAPGSRPQDAHGYALAAAGRWFVELDEASGILLRAGGSTVQYHDAGFDTGTVSASAGPILRRGDVTVAFEPTIAYQWLAAREERTIGGPTARIGWAVMPRLRLGLDGSFFWTDHRLNRGRNGEIAAAGATAEYTLRPNLRVAAGYSVQNEDTRNRVLASFRHGPLAVVSYRPLAELALNAAWQYQDAEYRRREPAFRERRRDRIHSVRLGANWDIGRLTSVEGLEMRGEYSWRESRSNLPIYAFDRHYVQLGFGYGF